MTEDELSRAVAALVDDWRKAQGEQHRIRKFKRIGNIRRKQIQDAYLAERRALYRIELLAKKAGMAVAVGSMPILVEAR